MKIPDSFRPKGDLDDRLQNLLKNKQYEFKHVKVSVSKQVHHGRIKSFSHYSRTFESIFTDELRILFDYDVGQVSVVDIRIFEGGCEKETVACTLGGVPAEDYELVIDTARKRIKAKEKNFDFNKLKKQVENDFELLKKLDDVFRGCPVRDYHHLILDNGVLVKLMEHGDSFSVEDQRRLVRIYDKHIKKYLS